jgi:hypothetical protein
MLPKAKKKQGQRLLGRTAIWFAAAYILHSVRGFFRYWRYRRRFIHEKFFDDTISVSSAGFHFNNICHYISGFLPEEKRIVLAFWHKAKLEISKRSLRHYGIGRRHIHLWHYQFFHAFHLWTHRE